MPSPASVGPILVVGASGTIGSAVARMLGADGHIVGLHYCKNRDVIDVLSRELQQAGAQTIVLGSSLGSIDDCVDLVSRFASQVGNFYGLAICSGRVPWKHWQHTDRPDWTDAYFEHCVAPFALARAAADKFLPGGRLVYLSSISSKYGGSDRTLHYAAAKAGLEAAMRGLSRELARQDIRVNGVRAGFADTPQQRAGRTPEELAARVRRIPLRRAGAPTEIASAFAYLFSEGAAFITGEIITVAGGD